MNRTVLLKHKFVEYLPELLEERTIYVSIRFATAAHRCCCGCGNEVVTPITPTDWQLTFDGESISLHPSIGNWNFPCQSHYWVRRNKVMWDRRMSRQEIEAGRAHDRLVKTSYFDTEPLPGHRKSKRVERPWNREWANLWRRLTKWFR